MDLFCVAELDELTGASGTHTERDKRVRLTFTHQTPLIQAFNPDALIKSGSQFLSSYLTIHEYVWNVSGFYAYRILH